MIFTKVFTIEGKQKTGNSVYRQSYRLFCLCFLCFFCFFCFPSAILVFYFLAAILQIP